MEKALKLSKINFLYKFLVHNVKSALNKTNLKVDKMEEADMMKSWTERKIDESRFKMQDFVDYQVRSIKNEIQILVKEELAVKDFVGENEPYKTMRDYFQYLEEKFKEHYNRFLDVDEDIFKITDKELPFIREQIDDVRNRLFTLEEEIK